MGVTEGFPSPQCALHSYRVVSRLWQEEVGTGLQSGRARVVTMEVMESQIQNV